MKYSLKQILGLLAMLMAATNFAAADTILEHKMALAEQGDAQAQYDIGYRYEKGRGVDEDEAAAFRWFRKAAEQELDKAEYKVGMYYLKGMGVTENTSAARTWLLKAADQGYPPAQYQLGKLYSSRFYKDYDSSLAWLQKAKDNGYQPAVKEIRKVKNKERLAGH